MADSYLDSGSNKQGLERFAGVTLLNPGTRHIVQRPIGEKGVTKFRIYPYFENNAEKPLRLEPDTFRARSKQPGAGPSCDNAFYSWIALEEMISMAGVSGKFTAFARVRGKDPRYQGPFHKFFRGMQQALKTSPNAYPRDWASWIGKQGALPFISPAGLIQGILYVNGGKSVQDQYGQANPMHPVVLVIPKTARESLEQLANLKYQGAQLLEEDFDKVYVHNQLVSCANGKMLTITYHPASGRNTTYYDCSVDPDVLPIPDALARSEFMPWDSLLYRMDEKEQLATLASHFPPESLSFIFDNSDFRDYLPQGVVGRWDAYVRNGGSYQVPAAMPGTGYGRQDHAEGGVAQTYSAPPPPPMQPTAPMTPAQTVTVPQAPAQVFTAPVMPAAPQARFDAPAPAPVGSAAPLPPGVPPIFSAPTIHKAFSAPIQPGVPNATQAPTGDPAVDRTQSIADARARLAEASKNLPPTGSPQH